MVPAVPTVVVTSHSGNTSRVRKQPSDQLVFPTVRQMLLTVPQRHYGGGQYKVTLTHHGYSIAKLVNGQWVQHSRSMQRAAFAAWLAAYIGTNNAKDAMTAMDGDPVKGMGSVARSAMEAACGSACRAGY